MLAPVDQLDLDRLLSRRVQRELVEVQPQAVDAPRGREQHERSADHIGLIATEQLQTTRVDPGDRTRHVERRDQVGRTVEDAPIAGLARSQSARDDRELVALLAQRIDQLERIAAPPPEVRDDEGREQREQRARDQDQQGERVGEAAEQVPTAGDHHHRG